VLIIWGLRVLFSTIAEGVFYCRNCGGDRNYQHRAGRRWFTLFFIPIIPLNKVGEDVRCTTCRTRYVPTVLNAPTAAASAAAIPAGVRAVMSLMLRTGDMTNPAARARAVEAVREAGQQDYSDAALDADLGQSMEAARPVIAQLGTQLRPEAREHCLSQALQVGMADEPLSDNERATAEMIATDLGLTKAQALGVISMTEQSPTQG
jgi:hypothetical protein